MDITKSEIHNKVTKAEAEVVELREALVIVDKCANKIDALLSRHVGYKYEGITYDGDTDKKLDGQLVKTEDGRVFLAQYRLADVYFLSTPNPETCSSNGVPNQNLHQRR